MDDTFVTWGRSRCRAQEVKNLRHFHVELFYTIIDMQLQDLNDHFNEINTYLLLCLACLCPNDLFSAFENEKLIHFAEYNP